LREVLIPRAHRELEVEQDELHRGVAHALADAEGGAVHPVDALLDGDEALTNPEAAVVVVVKVELHVGGAQAARSERVQRMRLRTPSGVAWPTVSQRHQARGAVVDGVLEERGEHLGARADGVLGDVGHREAVLHREIDGLGGLLQQPVDVPALGEEADG
jgi:hypothetical protein